MAGEDARLKSGLKTAEDELNLIKNQIQQTLLDIREHILDVTNPFNDVEVPGGDEEEVSIEDAGGRNQAGATQDRLPDRSTDPADEDDEVSGDEFDSEDDDGLSEDEMFDDDLPEDEFDDIPEDDVYGAEPVSEGEYGDGFTPESSVEEPFDEFEPEDDEEVFEDDVVAEDGALADDSQEDAVTEDAAKHETAADDELDLIKLASLVRWVAVTQSRLGPERTELLLDTYQAAGRVSTKVRDVLRTICALAEEDPDGSIPVRDIIASMVRMEGVLSVGNEPASANRMLGLLLELDDDPLDRLAA